MNKKSFNRSKHRGRILVIDDEPEIGWIFSKKLGDNGYEVLSSQTGKDGLNKVRKNMPDLVFLDLKLPDTSGVDILKEIKAIDPEILVIMITAHETIQTAVSTMKIGAYDYIPKPVPNERLEIIVDKALESHRLRERVDFLTKGTVALSEILGQSQVMQDLFKLIKSVSAHDVSVILRGESGTGKELVARAIHSLSKRKNKSFVPVDSATLPETLVESELFGYEKGAFTGAVAFKIGKFEMAEGGTLFLDEIGNLTTHIQIKLLRVLQERKIDRLGGKNPIPIDVRIISATNKDLEEAINKSEFRDDLYHRLNVFEIVLPPLREREEDVILIAKHLLERFNDEMGKSVEEISGEVIDIFRRYSWPGNVRELENTMKFAVISAKDKVLPKYLPDHIIRNAGRGPVGPEQSRSGLWPRTTESPVFSDPKGEFDKLSLKEAKKNVTENAEKYLIEKALNDTNWNKKKTAQALGIDYKGLFNKIKKYNIKR